MPISPTSKDTNELALRAGASGIYLVIGLVLGVSVAVTSVIVQGEGNSPSFAAVVFGVSAGSAFLAALFPNAALATISPIAHFFWGLLNGVFVPESSSSPEYAASRSEKVLFWLGVVVGCILLFLLLFTRCCRSAA